MKYIALDRNDFDRIIHHTNQFIFCYSERKIRQLSPDGRFYIVGLTREAGDSAEYTMDLGAQSMAVISPERRTNLRYRTVGYIPVEGYYSDHEYIAVQKRRTPVGVFLATMMDKLRPAHGFKVSPVRF